MSKKNFYILFIFIVTLFLEGCNPVQDDTPVSKTDFYFDTVITITLYGNKNEKYIDECFKMCKDYENKFSRTIKDSEVSKINEHAGSFIEVSEDTLELIKDGLSYSELSHGGFDITIGALSEVWNFNSENPKVPDSKEIAQALETVNYQNIIVDHNKVMLNKEGAILDLGGIAKGFIADKLKAYLFEQGVKSGIINLGGNILLIGSKPDGSEYNIGIKKPFGEENETVAVMCMRDKSIVSSGNYERYFYEDGKLYHHILDTSTGYPADNGLCSVTILSDDSVDGDGLSTTCFLSGLEKGMELIESMDDVEAVFIDSDEQIHYSSGLKKEKNTFTLK